MLKSYRCEKQRIKAGVAELADALDLGSSVHTCRFNSCHPHQNPRTLFSDFLFISIIYSTKNDKKRFLSFFGYIDKIYLLCYS